MFCGASLDVRFYDVFSLYLATEFFFRSQPHFDKDLEDENKDLKKPEKLRCKR